MKIFYDKRKMNEEFLEMAEEAKAVFRLAHAAVDQNIQTRNPRRNRSVKGLDEKGGITGVYIVDFVDEFHNNLVYYPILWETDDPKVAIELAERFRVAVSDGWEFGPTQQMQPVLIKIVQTDHLLDEVRGAGVTDTGFLLLL